MPEDSKSLATWVAGPAIGAIVVGIIGYLLAVPILEERVKTLAPVLEDKIKHQAELSGREMVEVIRRVGNNEMQIQALLRAIQDLERSVTKLQGVVERNTSILEKTQIRVAENAERDAAIRAQIEVNARETLSTLRAILSAISEKRSEGGDGGGKRLSWKIKGAPEGAPVIPAQVLRSSARAPRTRRPDPTARR